jgi:hypothetical protein
MRECAGCREFRTSLKTLRRSFAALSPVGAFGPLAVVAKALGLGGAGGGAAAGGSAVGGSAAVVGGATACKVAAVVCTAALATGGAVEVNKLRDHSPSKAQAGKVVKAAAPAVAAAAAAEVVASRVSAPVIAHRTEPAAPVAAPRHARHEAAAVTPAESVTPIVADAVTDLDSAVRETTGGTVAPPADPADTAKPVDKPAEQQAPAQQPSGEAEAPAQGDAATADPEASGGTPSSDGPPPEH